jgi:FG-GAP-like repeat
MKSRESVRRVLGVIIVLLAPAASVGQTVSLSSVAAKPNAPVSGNTSKGTVTLPSPAVTGGVVVTLSSSNTKVATVPSSVEVLAGNKTASFTIKTGSVKTATGVTIEATSANTKSARLTVNPATTVNWKGGPGPAFPITNQCFAADFNGDGKADLACYTGSGGDWNVVLSTGHGWKSEAWDGLPGGNGGPGPAIPVADQCFTGDFNGDGKTDLACYTGSSGIWNVALSVGNNWNSEFWNGGPLLTQEWNIVPVFGQCFVADFNGDGKTDLACADGVDGVWSVALSTGTGWNTQSWSNGPVIPLPITQQCLVGDLNGDSKADVFCWTGEGGGWGVGISTGSGWLGSVWSAGPTPVDEWSVVPVQGQCFAAKFNGDKKTDVACSNGTDGTWGVSLSTGAAWNTESWSGGPVVELPMTDQCLNGDFNGDGKADLACWTGEDGGWAVALSTGSGWKASIWNGGPSPIYEWNVIPAGKQCFAADFNGDGKTDLACYTSTAGVWSVALSSGHGW